jgi:hypothetical protein
MSHLVLAALGVFANVAFTRQVTVTYEIICAWGWWTSLVYSALAGSVVLRIVYAGFYISPTAPKSDIFSQ